MSKSKIFNLCLLGFPGLLYFITIYLHAYQFPHLDDFDSILKFLSNHQSTTIFTEKFRLVFEQHNDHRIALSKIIILAQFFIIQVVDIQSLIIIGNLSILGIFYLLWKSFPLESQKLQLFIPAGFALFNYSFYEGSLWAMVTLSGFMVVFFSMASLYFLGKNDKLSLIYSCLFAVIAYYTQGNGKLVFFAAVPILYAEKKKSKILTWFLLLLVLFISDRLLPQSFAGYSRSILELLKDPEPSILSFFTFLGSMCSTYDGMIKLGIAIALLFSFLMYKKLYASHPTLFSYILFLALNAAGVAYSRPYINHPSRYSLYSSLALAITYLAFMAIFSDRYKIWSLRIAQTLSYVCIPVFVVYYLYVSLFLNFYRATNLNYEKNIVLYFYDRGVVDRNEANASMKKEVENLVDDSLLMKLLPQNEREKIVKKMNERQDRIVGDLHPWWLDHIESFSNSVKKSEKLGIFDVSKLRD